MRQREHAMYESYLMAQEAAEQSVTAEKQMTEKEHKEKEDFYDALNKYRKQGELKRSELSETSKMIYDNHLQEVLEALYITALEQVGPLSENSYRIAVQEVENYIKESGGALDIIHKNGGKTYVLDKIFEAVITAHDKDMKTLYEAEKDDNDDDDDEKEDKSDDKKDSDSEKKSEDDTDHSDGNENTSGEDIKVGDADGDGVDDASPAEDGMDNAEDSEDKEDSDDKSDEEEDSEEKSDNDNEKHLVDDLDKDDDEEEDDSETSSDNNDNTDTNDLDDNSADDSEDSDTSDGDEEDTSDPVLDEPDTKESLDADGELKDSKEEMFDKLENDDEVSDAVDIIAKRISDAESEFIQKNAEDKKKIENIVNRVDDRIKAVTNSDESDEQKEEDKEATKQEATRMISDIKERRFHTVFEDMVQKNFNYIMKDAPLKESYTDVDGAIDVAKIVESSRVMYGFLEFVNTLQLEKVDENYILNIIKGE